ncbi:MAG: sigma-70 family RNA polymerase sigma factor [Acidobacteria bacterium]|nr:sigma-70 family RNA polymerase sigma factor [Acidobacteriota bacterium]
MQTPTDELAWTEFVNRFKGTVKKGVMQAALRLARYNAEFDGLSDTLIEDLSQAVYMRLIHKNRQALRQFNGEYENSIYRYIIIIAINVVRDYFREVRAYKRPDVMFSLDELLSRGGEAPDPQSHDAAFLLTQTDDPKKIITVESLEEMFHQVPVWTNKDRDITVFKLKYYEGLTNKEISRITVLQLSAEGVGASLNRTLKRIKKILQQRKRRE